MAAKLKTANVETLEAPPGIRCPACGKCELTLGADGDRPALTCPGCRVLVRLLQRHGDPIPTIDLGDVQADTPPAGSWWIGYVKGGDGIARPVSLGQTLGAAWDGALHCPLRGTIIVAPTDPPHRVTRQRVTAEGDG